MEDQNKLPGPLETTGLAVKFAVVEVPSLFAMALAAQVIQTTGLAIGCVMSPFMLFRMHREDKRIYEAERKWYDDYIREHGHPPKSAPPKPRRWL